MDKERIESIGNEISNLFKVLENHIKPGQTTEEIDDFCFNFFKSKNLIPAALNYKGYPKSVCISINEVVCHGVPNSRIITDKDIIKIDAAATDGEFFSDACEVFLMENAEEKKKKISKVNYEALWAAISIVKPGVTTGDIGYILEKYAKSYNFSVIRDFCGHGVGKKLHLDPQIPFYGVPFSGVRLKEGDIITIEPMFFDGKNKGNTDVKISEDGWTATIKNGTISSQFERTLIITSDGYEILTYTETDKKNLKLKTAKGKNIKDIYFKI